MAHLLLIDDEPAVPLAFLGRLAAAAGWRVTVARTGADGVAQATADRPDVILLDVDLPDRPGLAVFADLRAADARTPVVFVTASEAADTAIQAMSAGAFDYLVKPLDPARLRQVLEAAAEVSRLARGPAVLPPADGRSPSDAAGDTLVGRCPGMQAVYKAIGRVAPQDVPVLVLGESGTGKELVARAVYQHSRRADKPFLALNCAAIPDSLLESELFGHEKGAFTGADRKRVGKFEQCHGGTLFLDEVGELSPLTQAKLLRVLQDGRFERVGGDETVQTDVRIIAATNRDLKALAAAGRFRSDLYYRLAVFSVHLPPLRDRGDDIDALAQHFVRRFARELRRDVTRMADDVRAALRGYLWPGNVRELQAVLKQALLTASGPLLLARFLPPELGGAAAEPAAGRSDWVREFARSRLAAGTTDLYAEAVRSLERVLLPLALADAGGNQQRAAERLGLSPKTLRLKLRELGLDAGRGDPAAE